MTLPNPTNAPSPELVDEMLLKMSAQAATGALRDAGYTVALKQLETRVSQLIAEGVRKPLATGSYLTHTGGPTETTAVYGQEKGCAKLHDATLALFKRIAAANREEVRTVAVWLQGTLDARGVVA